MTMATIDVQGAFAKLTVGDPALLEGCLSFDSPARFFSKAFKSGHWDGKIRLFSGNTFHAGLTPTVVAHIEGQGTRVSVSGWKEKQHINTDEFPRDYLAPAIPELWAHQMDAIRAILTNSRGIIKSPTGSGKTAIVAAGARYLWDFHNMRSLVIVPKKGLLHQTVAEFERMFQGDIEVGMLGDGIRRVGPITVGTSQTVIKFQSHTKKVKGKAQRVPADPCIREVVRDFEVLWLDETHRASSDSWQTIALASRAKRRYGLSGTPKKGDEISDLKMVGATGPNLIEVPSDVLIKKGLASKPKIVMLMSDAASGKKLFPKLPYRDAYDAGIVENHTHNKAVVDAVGWLVDNQRQTLLLCRRKQHFKYLSELLDAAGISHYSVWGDTQTDDRDLAKKALKDKKVPVVLATTIWDEGEDIPSIDAIVLAEGVKVSTNALQRIGRGMRKGGDNEVWVVDFAPTCHPIFLDHAAERCEAYEKEGYDVVVKEDWDGEFPFKVWNSNK
jgi:superfamily II DNA or RNA helicase